MTKKLILKLFVVVIFIGFGSIIKAQSCNYFHKRYCESMGEAEMKEDMQSKSALFSKGQQSSFNLVAYQGQDYRIVLCSDQLFTEPLEFRIYEKVRVLIEPQIKSAELASEASTSNESDDTWASEGGDEWGDSSSDDGWGSSDNSQTKSSGKPKPKYKLVKELLYDNANDDMSQEIEFTADNTKSLIIEVKVPGEEVVKKLMIKEVGCVGVLVEHKKSGNLGF
tara:strand:- start:1141 stop:1809 length:669 start_codon:yes stop_codon:yes gene_type:complete